MKKAIKLFCILIVLSMVLGSFFACGFLDGNSGNVNDSKNEGGIKTEKKISFSEARGNYEKEEYKCVDLTSTFNISLFLKSVSKDEQEPIKHTIGVSTSSSRIYNKETFYAEGELTPSDEVTDSVVGLLTVVKTAFSGNGIFEGVTQPDEDTKAILSQSEKYIKILQDFLQEKIYLSAKVGVVGDDINFKGKYEYQKPNVPLEVVERWLFLDKEYIENICNRENELWANSTLASLYPGFSKGTDSASDRVDKNGIAQYNITFDNGKAVDKLTSQLVETLQLMLGNEDTTKQSAVIRASETIKKWIKAENSIVNATVNDSKLPSNIYAKTAVLINIPIVELRTMLLELVKEEIIADDTASVINFVAFLLSSYTLGTDGELNTIGMEFIFEADESYVYEKAKCSLSDKDAELFLSDNEETINRIDIQDYIKNLGEEGAREYLSKTLEVLGDESTVIINMIEQEIDFTKKVTLMDVKTVMHSVLSEYLAENAEKQAIINQILEILFPGE